MKFLDMVGSSPITGVSAIRYTQLSPATCVRRSGSCTLRRVRCSAADDASPGTSSAAGADTGLRPGGEMTRAPPPLPVKGMKLEKVERLGEEAWAGVAAVDRGEGDLGRLALLLGGDAAVLLLFVAIGRANHGQTLDPQGVFTAAVPFLIGWTAAGAIVGGYSKEARNGNLASAALATLKTWAVGIPVAVAIRTAQKGYIPDKSFILVGLGVTFVMMMAWRCALAAATPEKALVSEEVNRRKDKRGNPLEFLQVLTSLTKRW